MIVKELKLRNYRSYDVCEIHFHPKLNLITGHNAQGKTNLLESLVYLSLTRSHRIANEKKLIRTGCAFADIRCIYEDGMDKELEAIIHEKGKTLKVHRQIVKRSSEFVGQLNVVLFAPDDLRIFADSPQVRRRLLNQEITKVSRSYLQALNAYQNFLKQRNSLLKGRSVNMTLLDTLDERMAHAEYTIIQERRKFIEIMNTFMSPIYKALSSDTIDVSVRYKCCLNDANVTLDEIRAMHRNVRAKDLETRSTNAGIHREDIVFEMNGSDLLSVASQGQKRMTMLSFKMALLKYIENQSQKAPVLLLDDVLSELDETRQRKLLEMVGNSYQCVITATEVPDFLKDRSHKRFLVEDGKVAEISGGER